MSGKDFAVGVLVGGIAGMLTGIVISKCSETYGGCLGLDDIFDEDDDSNDENESGDVDEKETSDNDSLAETVNSGEGDSVDE